MGNFRRLFDIRVEHVFFSDRVCNSLQFIPTARTSRIIQNCGLLIRPVSGGVQLLYEQSRIDALRLYIDDAQEALEFEFRVFSRDSLFKSYTQPFDDVNPGVLFFENLTRKTGIDKGARLHGADSASSNDFVAMSSEKVQGILDRGDRLVPPEFVVKINAGPAYQFSFDKISKGDVPGFYIKFETRQTKWKYYLNNPSVSADSVFVHDEENRIDFETGEDQVLADGRRVKTFRSRQSIPLRQYYDFRFQLKQKKNGREKILVKQLPVASMTSIGMDIISSRKEIVSEIYLNY